jgi:pilus assembly protein CpaF
MVGLGGIEIPILTIRKLIASSVQLIIQVSRLPGGSRKIVSISEITGIEGEVISMHDLFVYVQTGIDEKNVVQGYFKANGIRPQCFKKLNARGAALPLDLFSERRLPKASSGDDMDD